MNKAPSTSRNASVLIVVVAFAALLLTTFVVISRQLQSESQDGIIILRDSQARLMLPAALAFVLESARCGQSAGVETFGWTDVRDGGVGPRGPRTADGKLPPEIPDGRWPGRGSVYRADFCRQLRPPHAVQPLAAYNPIFVNPEWLQEWEGSNQPENTMLGRAIGPVKGNGTEIGQVPADPPENWTSGSPAVLRDDGAAIHWERVWEEIFQPMNNFETGFHHSLSPQPIADNLSDFRSGDRTLVAESTGLSWFRIYREKASDHNGDGQPWFDNMPLSGHGVFIITCGAGATRGYRDWSEVNADGASHIFDNDPYLFEDLRAQERILWYRVEWSGFTGGGVSTAANKQITNKLEKINPDHQNTSAWTPHLDSDTNLHTHRAASEKINAYRQMPNTHIPLFNLTGTIKWIERLEHEPTSGSQPGQGGAIW